MRPVAAAAGLSRRSPSDAPCGSRSAPPLALEAVEETALEDAGPLVAAPRFRRIPGAGLSAPPTSAAPPGGGG
ncbi:MAG: hypothetical protein VXZ39_05115, partial [Planctomycetota bacterium]|nr:hypothetical protein [Planctomycetota bacterium]